MKLYMLKTIFHNDFYIVANDPTQAENRLTELLDKAKFRWSYDRIVKSIIVIADELKNYSWTGGKPNFPEYDSLLILPTSCEEEQK
jgi:ribonucleotide monophosphatase NagD (HAD superfamily)